MANHSAGPFYAWGGVLPQTVQSCASMERFVVAASNRRLIEDLGGKGPRT